MGVRKRKGRGKESKKREKDSRNLWRIPWGVWKNKEGPFGRSKGKKKWENSR